MVTSTHLVLVFVLVDSCCDIFVLLLNVEDHIAVEAVEADLVASEPDLFAHLSGDLLEADLLVGQADLAE